MIGDAAPTQMRAAVWRGPNQIAVELCPTPEIEEDWDVLVRVRASIFGAALVRAITVGHPRMKPPAVLGSLIAGDVVSTGAKVNGFELGARVVVDPHPRCGACANCLVSNGAACPCRAKVEPGGLAEYVRIRPPLVAHILRIPDELSYEHAAYTETVACVAHSIQTGGVNFGDTVAIVGCGPVALVQTQLALLRGATRVICLYNHAERVPAITQSGAVPVNANDEDAPERVRALSGSGGADVVVEATGRAATYTLALALVRPSGTVVAFGGCPAGTSMSVDPNYLHYNGIRLIGSYHYAQGMFERALNLLGSGRVNLCHVLTHRLPLDLVAQAAATTRMRECLALSIMP